MFTRIDFEAQLSCLFGGVKNFTPIIYLGLYELEFNKPYNVVIKLSPCEVPKTRSKDSHVAVYALLYKLSQGEIHIKFGAHSAFVNTAGLIWAQAPLYARVIGIFRLKRSMEQGRLELFEETCVKYLNKVWKSHKIRAKFSTRIPPIEKIVDMWMNIDKSMIDIEDLLNMVDNVAAKCFKQLSEIDWIDPLYGSDFWFMPPIERLVTDLSYVAGLQALVQSSEKSANSGVGIYEGVLKITPMGLCFFEEESSGSRRIYIDVCRRLIYHFEVSMK